jgi:hypothetical protein
MISYYKNYDFHFGQLDREKKYSILEIGVRHGGGLWTLKEYFPNSSITGLDIDGVCKQYENKDDDVEVFIGSQLDKDLLEKMSEERGPFDIIIDDGGHHMKQQKISFFKLFPLMNDGIYVVEDLHTSYWSEFGGGMGNKETMMNFLKQISDKSTSRWASRCERADREKNNLELDYLDRYIDSVHFYDSICFIYKKHCKNLDEFISGYKSSSIVL